MKTWARETFVDERADAEGKPLAVRHVNDVRLADSPEGRTIGMAEGAEAVAQGMAAAALADAGEVRMDTGRGAPMAGGVIGGGAAAEREWAAAVRRAVSQVEGVEELESFVHGVSGGSAWFRAQARTPFGEARAEGSAGVS